MLHKVFHFYINKNVGAAGGNKIVDVVDVSDLVSSLLPFFDFSVIVR